MFFYGISVCFIDSNSTSSVAELAEDSACKIEPREYVGYGQTEKVNESQFKKLNMLGEGGFGKVYLVQKIEGADTGELYAMKVLKKATLQVADKLRTKMERDILAQVAHPFIVKLHYAFQTEERLYLVLDFLRGGDLFTLLSKEHILEEELVRFYIAELVLALEHLHSLGIVYRDLKPENVLICQDGHITLIDFGLSKKSLDAHEQTYSICGTVEYMAPEILSSRGHSFAVDYWSVGVLTFEMLTGNPPFCGEDQDHVKRMITRNRVRFPKYLGSEATSFLRELLQRAPEKRLGSGHRGHQDVKDHTFFKGINWDRLYRKEIEPPHKPVIADDLTSNFDAKYTEKEPTESVAEPISSHSVFQGFSFCGFDSVLDSMNNLNFL